MTETERVAREVVERVIAAGAAQGRGGVVLPQPHLDPPPADAPAPVTAAIRRYDALPDWLDLCRHLCRVPSPVGELYLLVEGFEITDGWLEVFGPAGEPLGAAQYLGARVGWASVEEVRDSLLTGAPVPALRDPPG